MSAETGSTSQAKPADPITTNGGGFRPQLASMTVEPPKQGDLQMSYASIVGDEDANPRGWYGSMSTSYRPIPDGPHAKIESG